ncbi:MAG: hypothetical protein HYY42_01775 [Chloroflexi bacterium]|nr:hypothetical protein [Chloroflexota bacterium]MBI2982911.1 hypothetical protein [Chloroflexota bacterium]
MITVVCQRRRQEGRKALGLGPFGAKLLGRNRLPATTRAEKLKVIGEIASTPYVVAVRKDAFALQAEDL